MYRYFPIEEIHPTGLLLQQLKLQANGLAGNLDKVWRDVKDSAYVGGDAEGWERVPYWLDGFIPLAYLLRDKDMIARAKKYMDAILSSQKEDGWMCPCQDDDRKNYDPWAILLLSKVLLVYYKCTHEERVFSTLAKMMKNYYDGLKDGTYHLFGWGKSRWFEGCLALHGLRRIGEPWVKDMAKILHEQGTDYMTLTEEWKECKPNWTQESHIVNLCMMIKAEIASYSLIGEHYQNHAEYLYQFLKQYNGTPVGLFTGDECLSGLNPTAGTELCAVAELMFSCQLLAQETGDKRWLERLEILAFNAMPATFSDDMWAHQYVQMSNQICAKRMNKSPFQSNNEEAHTFGLEPNFGCCTANQSQAFPKLTWTTFMRDDTTIVCGMPLPCKVNSEFGDLELITEYPFRKSLCFEITARKDFTLRVRMPIGAVNPKVNGANLEVINGFASFYFPKGKSDKLVITFEQIPEYKTSPCGMTYVQCGSLIYSLSIKSKWEKKEYVRDGVERKFPYCDYEVTPQSDWQFAYCNAPLDFCECEENDEIPFSSIHPKVCIKTKMLPINWGFEEGFEDNLCAKVPHDLTPLGPAEDVVLVPYGCAKLRITETPLVQ